jgi:DNA-binding NarL/FixJ family response regulator
MPESSLAPSPARAPWPRPVAAMRAGRPSTIALSPTDMSGAPRTMAASERRIPMRVAIADDSFLIREALRDLLEPIETVEVVGTFGDGDTLLARIDEDPPDVVITDIRMPPTGDSEGIRVARELRKRHPEVGVVVLSQYAGVGYALALLEDHAEGRGYLLKERVHDRTELLSALEVVAQGGTTIDPSLVRELIAAERQQPTSPIDELTPREREVLAEMAAGKSNAAIAESLVLTKRAVEKHVGAIFQKLLLEDDEVVSRRVTAVLLYLASTQAASPRHADLD